VRPVLEVAQALAAMDTGRAKQVVAALEAQPARDEVLAPADESTISPTLRAQALARVLLDLATNGWTISVEEGQVYVTAPEWSVGGQGLSPEAIQAEKSRARQSMAERVQEQLERPPTRRFILEQERAHFAADGARSILSLIADGPALAQTLRREGAAGIRPYLQRADSDVRDTRTGLLLSDIFRYFRYFWSFPFGSTPGRTLSLLIRDAGQPNHPVCGLLCLASPVPRLAVRDGALGWSPAWLEAVVAALDLPIQAPEPHLRALEQALPCGAEGSVEPTQLFADLSVLLGVEAAGDARALARSLTALGGRGLQLRLTSARKRLVTDLMREVEDALRDISFEGLGVEVEEALKDPEHAEARLAKRVKQVRSGWEESRKVGKKERRAVARVREEALNEPEELEARTHDPLFLKKRVIQALPLLSAWAELRALEGAAPARLRQLVLGHTQPWGAHSGSLSGGEHISRGLRVALLQRQGRFVASQVADVSVCGAVPPYGPLLGGKLAALAALSGEVAERYHERYSMQLSQIRSQMAGRQIFRPADLVALTTTSFYGVGSSQYSRVVLPPALGGVRWKFVGYSRGHGTMHFSRATSAQLQRLVRVETGKALITSTFGEGPSERMRKVREGLSLLDLPAEELLMHGMPRQVYLAELSTGATRPGSRAPERPWRRAGPALTEVVRFWRERWLGPRLSRSPQLLEDLATFSGEDVLLSRRLGDSPFSSTAWAVEDTA
jgi:hypothetical protein